MLDTVKMLDDFETKYNEAVAEWGNPPKEFQICQQTMDEIENHAKDLVGLRSIRILGSILSVPVYVNNEVPHGVVKVVQV